MSGRSDGEREWAFSVGRVEVVVISLGFVFSDFRPVEEELVG